jgi:hypothetical protein
MGRPSGTAHRYLAFIVFAVAVKSGLRRGNKTYSEPPTRTGRDPSDRASRWKQLLVAVDDAIASLHVRLGREASSPLASSLESAPATRGRGPGVA